MLNSAGGALMQTAAGPQVSQVCHITIGYVSPVRVARQEGAQANRMTFVAISTQGSQAMVLKCIPTPSFWSACDGIRSDVRANLLSHLFWDEAKANRGKPITWTNSQSTSPAECVDASRQARRCSALLIIAPVVVARTSRAYSWLR